MNLREPSMDPSLGEQKSRKKEKQENIIKMQTLHNFPANIFSTKFSMS